MPAALLLKFLKFDIFLPCLPKYLFTHMQNENDKNGDFSELYRSPKKIRLALNR